MTEEDEEAKIKKADSVFATAFAGLVWLQEVKQVKPGTHGKDPCPIKDCKGTLRWSCSLSNGHIHAKCSEPDCISFIQ